MKKLLLCSFIFLSVLAGCKKTGDQAPVTVSTPSQPSVPTHGALSGTISPASAITRITASTSLDTSYIASLDTATGAFNIPDMAPGNYVLGFANASPFFPRLDTSVLVTVGQTNNIGTLSFQKGSLFTGMINPANAVYYIRAYNVQNTSGSAAYINAATGVFTSRPLPAGTYEVSFSPASGYKVPSTQTVTLGLGQVVDLGTITVGPNLLSGLPFNIGNGLQTYAAPLLTIHASSPSTGGITGPSYNHRFTLKMDEVTGVGTYPCRGTTASSMTYQTGTVSFGTGLQNVWSTNNPGGSGTVVVTAVDPVKKEISGTFTATLANITPNTANVVINNGSFHFSY